MGLIDYMRNKIRSFLRVDGANNTPITIMQKLDYYGNVAKNRIWYRGDSSELSQLYGQIDVQPTMFWKATCTKGMEIRKIHTGLPKLIVKTLTDIVINDYNGVEFADQPILEDEWNKIAEENKSDKLIRELIKEILIVGDGALKVSFDRELSDLPIIEFYSGEYVEYTRKRGRITEVVFVTEYVENHKKYVFKEHYGYGYIKYKLENENGVPLPVNYIPQTAWATEDGVKFDKSVMLAVPVILGESEQYPGRGESIYDGKTDNFDALDEAWSQWMDALRAARTKQYIPDCLLPRNPNTGEIIAPNAFDNRYIATGNDMAEDGKNRIALEQPAIPHDSYLSTYITALDLCLQGIISPSTLGIDVKKLDNAEAQREKEKTTLYTRGNIIELLNSVIPALVVAAVCGDQIWHNKLPIEKPNVTVKFGEYANPSFESQVETIGKAKTQGVMSIEACIDELYGDSKSDDWKSEEVERLKAEQGIATVDDTGVPDDLGGADFGY